jgi:hypothetical protein
MPTPRDTILRDGTASLYRFRRAGQRVAEAGPPVLLVPSLINRWYVLDLRPGASLAAALVEAGLDVFCLDWAHRRRRSLFELGRRAGALVAHGAPSPLRDGASELGCSAIAWAAR